MIKLTENNDIERDIQILVENKKNPEIYQSLLDQFVDNLLLYKPCRPDYQSEEHVQHILKMINDKNFAKMFDACFEGD